MAQVKSRRASSSGSKDAGTLDEIRKAVRADRRKIAHIPVTNLELKRSTSSIRV
jgi:hypothetical protein